MVVAEIGYWSLVLALAATLCTTVAFTIGARRSTRLLASANKALIASWALITLAIVTLTYALLARQFQIKYVYEHTSITLPLVYTLSAMWAGQEGSLLLWLWLVAGLTVVVARRRTRVTGLHPYALAALSTIQSFFAAVLVCESNPFTLLPETPSDGFGLNPLLQNVGMVIHPPLIFTGYAAFAMPFALAVAALINGCPDSSWLRSARPWSLFAWGTLGAGILVGAWWAYRELGWGGYWSWDPVENASLIPWLTGTAMLHSTMAEERRGVFRVWNVALATATFLLCLFATLVTRSGFIQSVHAFGRSRIGYYFLGFIVVWLLLVVILVMLRRRTLSSQHELRALLSRESGLLVSNLLLLGMALAVLLGTLFPALMEIAHGTQAVLGQAFYERVAAPLALTTVILMGVCPWLAWGRTQPDNLGRKLAWPAGVALLVTAGLVLVGVRRVFAVVSFGVCTFVAASILSELARGFTARRQSGENPTRALVRLFGKARHRYGGYLVHLSIVLIFIGIIGSSVYKVERLVAFNQGETVTIGGYNLTYEGLQFESLPDKELARATLRVNGHQRAVLSPELNFHRNVKQQISEVAVLSTLKEDLYVALVGWDYYGELASFLVLINPLVTWLWIGGGLMVLSTIITLWPKTAGGQR